LQEFGARGSKLEIAAFKYSSVWKCHRVLLGNNDEIAEKKVPLREKGGWGRGGRKPQKWNVKKWLWERIATFSRVAVLRLSKFRIVRPFLEFRILKNALFLNNFQLFILIKINKVRKYYKLKGNFEF